LGEGQPPKGHVQQLGPQIGRIKGQKQGGHLELAFEMNN
jgi:hypothetical protein